MRKSAQRESQQKETWSYAAVGNPQPQREFFQGELMTCVICGLQEQSNPAVNSHWRAVQWNDLVYYVCPGEMPADGAGEVAFRAAYLRVLRAIADRESAQ